MATKRKTPRRGKNRISGILPESAQVFLARRIVDTLALTFGFLGLISVLALMSYNRLDPSWNAAGPIETEVQNWIGLPGAHLSDLLLQSLGAGSLVFSLVFIAWAWRLLKRKPLRPFWFRFAMTVMAALLLSTALAVVPSGGWLPQPYLGGSGGTLMLNVNADLLQPVVPRYAHMATAAFAALLGLFCFAMALAVSRDGWACFLRIALKAPLLLFQFLFETFHRFTGWVRDNDRSAPAIKKPKKAPRITAPKLEPDVAAAPFAETPPDTKEPAILTPRKTPASEPPKAASQDRFRFDGGGEWELPPVNLLQDIDQSAADERPDEALLRKNAQMLSNVLSDFNVRGEIVSIHPGPVVTLYEFEPAPGIKTSRIISLSDDIARSMSAVSVRCAVVPGRNVIGIELPNRKRQTVFLRELLEAREVQKTHAKLPLILGKEIGGQPVVADLTKMPHLLVAGTTGSGKSVAVNTMILSLLYRLPPEKCRFIMIDPKMLELSVYDDIPHLLSPVVTEPGKAVVSLKWTVNEMEERYRAMSKLGVRNIEGYNARLREARRKGESLTRRVQTGFDPDTGKPVYEETPMDMTELPYIVVVVDEFADLMLVAGKDVESAIQRLAQMARAAGIHLIMATQRPSVDVITGVIKANFPTRISFAVTSKIDSRTILGEGGAEQLLGMGDMLYMAAGGRIARVHGPFVSDYDVESVTTYLKAQGEPAYIEEITDEGFTGDSEVMGALFGDGPGGGSGVDEMYDEAVAIVARERKASTSFIQRCLQIGYNRAARIIEEMEKQGVVSKATATGKREVLISDHSGYSE